MSDRITSGLTKYVGGIVEACGASAVLVYADALADERLVLSEDFGKKVLYVTRTLREQQTQASRGAHFIRVPDVPLSRLAQVKVALFLALTRGLVEKGEVVVCLSGLAQSHSLDTLVVMQIGEEFEMFAAGRDRQDIPSQVRPEVVERVLDLASELGKEGREGQAVGAIFVLGDSDRVLTMTRQLILNPFRGYPEAQRNILDHSLEETVKELAAVDGAFVVRGDGIIESCGAYIRITHQDDFHLPQGLGSRHHAAAAITSVTDSLAITVSQSTGTVTVFGGGRIITELEKPRAATQIARFGWLRD